jgi:hypothetical protein
VRSHHVRRQAPHLDRGSISAVERLEGLARRALEPRHFAERIALKTLARNLNAPGDDRRALDTRRDKITGDVISVLKETQSKPQDENSTRK